MSLVIALVLLGVSLYALLISRSVFILAYHGVGEEECDVPGLVIRPDAFRKQIRLLAALRLQPKLIDALLDDIRYGRRRWRPTLSITFDDGYRSILENAIPLLEEMGWRATIFVPTDQIGKWNDWDSGNGFPRRPLLDWDELEFLARSGNSVGSHGRSHRSLLLAPEGEAAAELRESLAILRSRLPGSSRTFCYPFGHRHAGLARLAEEAGYVGACSAVAGALPRKDELFDLGRLIVRSNSIWIFLFDLARYPVKSLARNVFRRAIG